MPGATASVRKKNYEIEEEKKAQGAHNRFASLSLICGVWCESPHNANDLNLNDNNRQ